MSSTDRKQHRRPYTFGPLYDLLLEHFPGHHSKPGQLAVQKFANGLGYAHETIYKAIRQTDNLKVGVALSVLRFSREDPDALPLFWEDLAKYTLPEFEQFTRSAEPEGTESPEDVDDLLS